MSLLLLQALISRTSLVLRASRQSLPLTGCGVSEHLVLVDRSSPALEIDDSLLSTPQLLYTMIYPKHAVPVMKASVTLNPKS